MSIRGTKRWHNSEVGKSKFADNKNLCNEYFVDNTDDPDNLCQMAYTKLFRLAFAGSNGNNL